jgi:nicotinamidase-related amidase
MMLALAHVAFQRRTIHDRNALRAGARTLLVDPYNDFLSDGGKVWPFVEEVATEVGLLDNLRAVVAAARAAGVQVFIVPHRRWREGNYQNWNYLTTDQARGDEVQIFAAGSWGGDWHRDFASGRRRRHRRALGAERVRQY